MITRYLPTDVLKSFINGLLPPITKRVNTSIKLREGILSTKCKEAIIRPLIKKASLELDFFLFILYWQNYNDMFPYIISILI